MVTRFSHGHVKFQPEAYEIEAIGSSSPEKDRRNVFDTTI